ncbi:MAG: acetyl-CoA synthetase [bacterium]|nr:MAG: acetyl-CoA synthetase [bacterium]
MTEEKTITSMMIEDRVFEPSDEFKQKAAIKSMDEYKKMHRESVENPEAFWEKITDAMLWDRRWDKFWEWDFNKADIKFFINGKINASKDCLDKHLDTPRRDKTALIWEGEPEGESRTFTYKELYLEVCKFANVLKKLGVKKGDRVTIYLPMIPELPIAMLACARIGAIHSVVFGGFSADSLRDRIIDCRATFLVTSNYGYRSGKTLSSKANADDALKDCPDVEKVVVVKRIDKDTPMKEGRDLWWDELMAGANADCPAEVMDAEDPLYILYTSGSTGKPKGVLHTIGGYLTYIHANMKYIFDVRDEDIFWCTADIGWVTGHSFIVYGPLSVGTTTLMFEGVPNWPEPDRFWKVVEKYRVNIFYTAPTALRALIREGNEWPNKRNLSSLRLLGTVGEPINPEAWIWYHEVIGKKRCPIVDTYWQTETGGIIITPLPGAIPTKPGSATMPFPGVDAVVLREDGSEAEENEGGYLCIKKPWPGMMRTVYGAHELFHKTYFTRFPGIYYTGDGARRDEDGYFWVMGRLDDVINVSGHRMGTAEIESALVSHPTVSEAAVVGYPHELKGQGIYAFVTLKLGVEQTDDLKKQLVAHVRKEIGPIAAPDKIHYADALPKTRSGKIMRRILKKIAAGDISNIGDTTTLADPSVVDILIKKRL